MPKRYVDTSLGQIHLAIHPGRETPGLPDLVCLHPIPYSGIYFNSLIPAINAGRDIITPDYPGYGSSDFYSATPGITDYAATIAELLQTLTPDEPVDLLGFHTGCLVAAELQLTRPELVRRSILFDVPYFNQATRQQMLQQTNEGKTVPGSDQECLAPAWEFNISKRLDAEVPLTRAFELFVEQLRAGENANSGFYAAFNCPCEEKFSQLKGEYLVLASRSSLHDATLQANAAIAGSKLVELEISSAVLETGVTQIADVVNNFLEE
ncbi:MAG: alpha/beta fold hydrolase [Gammaproteobacteria bacterium]